jgi:uncharacterized membrane protein
MSSPLTSRQLDLFRGVAAILMVLNHAGFHWLAPGDASTGADGVAVFLGSAAPALFFFATGVGMGLSRRSAVDWPAIARKVVLLLVADLFLGWGVGRWLGLDFFAFCAISMLAVSLVSATRRPIAAAAAGIAVCLALRYAFVAHLQPLAAEYPVLAFVSGIEGITDVSYPLSPWLVFPLAGFILGRLSALQAGARARWLVVGGLAVAGEGLFWLLASRGAVVHRWNTVSVAYFVFAVGFVVAVWLLAGLLAALPNPAALGWLQIRGPASLLVVPLHYAVIAIAASLIAPPWPAPVWLPVALVFSGVVLAGCQWLAACLRRWADSPGGSRGLALSLPACATVIAISVVTAPPLVYLLAACVGQVLVAANLARPDAAVTQPRATRAL